MSAYLIDSVLLLAFVLIFLIVAGLVLLLSSNKGRTNAPDSAYYAFIVILLGGSVIGWSLFNVTLLWWRGQTAGMYIVGIRAVDEDGRPISIARVLIRWFTLHPLLFHPVLLPLWVLFALLAVSVTLSQVVLIVLLGLVLLCAVSPIAALITVLLDRERRALHDRVSRSLVVHVDQT